MQLKKKLIFSFFLLYVVTYAQHNYNLDEAILYYEEGKYSAAQSIFDNILESDEALYYSAECSKTLFAKDAKYKFQKHSTSIPDSYII